MYGRQRMVKKTVNTRGTLETFSRKRDAVIQTCWSCEMQEYGRVVGQELRRVLSAQLQQKKKTKQATKTGGKKRGKGRGREARTVRVEHEKADFWGEAQTKETTQPTRHVAT